jgi:hypothetical protein
MTGLFLASYVLGPLVMLVASAGAGLLLWRLAGRTLPGALVLPLGFAVLLAVGTFLTAFSFTARLNAVAIVLLGVGGLALERRAVLDAVRGWRGWAWSGLAALGAYAMVIGPAMSTGGPSWTGYARITDLAQQMEWAEWLATHGREIPPVRDGSFHEVISKTAVTGYPGAGNSVFAGVAQLMGVSPIWLYQTLMAFTAAMLVLAVYGLLAGLVRERWVRAAGGFIAAQPNTLFGYALVGGIKEFTSAFALVFCAAVVGVVRPREDGVRGMLPLVAAISAGIGTFSLTIGPWYGALLGLAVLITVLVRGEGGGLPRIDVGPLRAWAGIAVLAAALSAPMLYWATQLAKVAVQAEGSGATALIDLGNLAAPIPARASLGVWISGDYRVPSLGDTPATALIGALVAALAAVGLYAAWRRRDRGVLLLSAAGAVALVYYTQRTGPWIQLKSICLSGPIVLALACAGARRLAEVRLPGRAGIAAAVVAGAAAAAGVLAGNAMAIHDITLAPSARMHDLEQVGDRFAGQGPAVYPAHEEYAEYFLRDLTVNALVNPGVAGIGPPQLRPDVLANGPVPSFGYDLDAFIVTWLERNRIIVVRRGPLFSRPPATYRRVRRSRFTDVWRRTSDPGRVIWHVAVPGAGPDGIVEDCKQLVFRARPDMRVAWAIRPQTVTAHLGDGELTRAWERSTGDTVLMNGPGSSTVLVTTDRSGPYRVWMQGPVQRPVTVTVDGRRVGAVSDAWSYPQGWTLVGSTTLRAGNHTVRISRPAGRPVPGDGAGGFPVGPVVLERADDPAAQTVRTAPATEARAVCSRAPEYDWVELLRG